MSTSTCRIFTIVTSISYTTPPSLSVSVSVAVAVNVRMDLNASVDLVGDGDGDVQRLPHRVLGCLA
jgi:hypothetical protein